MNARTLRPAPLTGYTAGIGLGIVIDETWLAKSRLVRHCIQHLRDSVPFYTSETLYSNICLGGWYDNATGVYCLDLTICVDSLAKAQEIGRNHGQRYIWSFRDEQSIAVLA